LQDFPYVFITAGTLPETTVIIIIISQKVGKTAATCPGIPTFESQLGDRLL